MKTTVRYIPENQTWWKTETGQSAKAIAKLAAALKKQGGAVIEMLCEHEPAVERIATFLREQIVTSALERIEWFDQNPTSIARVWWKKFKPGRISIINRAVERAGGEQIDFTKKELEPLVETRVWREFIKMWMCNHTLQQVILLQEIIFEVKVVRRISSFLDAVPRRRYPDFVNAFECEAAYSGESRFKLLENAFGQDAKRLFNYQEFYNPGEEHDEFARGRIEKAFHDAIWDELTFRGFKWDGKADRLP